MTIAQATTLASEPISYDDTPAKLFLYPSLVFLVVGMAVGLFMSFNTFIFPDYFSGEYIHFGRIRPVHVAGVTLLWLLSANLGLFYHFVPRLCGRPIWSLRLAYYSAVIWWVGLIIGVFSFPWGTNFGWEYAELPTWVWWFPTKFLFALGWILTALNLSMTIGTRKYEKLYVSLWYTMGTIIWTTFTVLVGTFVINWVPQGISRVNTNFFYVHNLVGLIFTPMGLAQAYYYLPKSTGVPIYSHRLSMIGFWSIAFIYAWIGAHHIIHGPVSQWLQTTSIIFSIWLFIPVWTVVTNLFATMEQDWSAFNKNAATRFLIMGVIFYLITCVQGPLMALRNVNEITSKTDWVIGHSHVSLFATFTFFATAGIYQAIPALTKKPLWSKALADWHYSLTMLGTIPFILALWIGGFLQGYLWSTWADGANYAQFHNQLTRLSFVDTISDMHYWWLFRSLGGAIILFANIIFVINIFNTIVLKPGEKEEVIKGIKVGA